MKNEPIEVTLQVTGVLEKLNIPYLVGGSLASTLHGMVRTTQDSDIVAVMKPEDIGGFIAGLKDAFFIDERMVSEAVRQKSSFNIIHRETMFKVDIFIPPAGPFLVSQIDRAQTQVFEFGPGASARFASPEDVILSKLEWYRSGGEISDRQWRDVLGIMKVQSGNLDINYLKKWAHELRIADLLERALDQSA